MVRKIGRINRTPPRTATRAPRLPPMTWPQAIVPAIVQATFPKVIKTAAETRLLVKFMALVKAVARSKSMPATVTQASAQKAPVPGPKKPS